MTNDFTITFWGVRGSRPVPGPQTIEYGGNTACVELRCDGQLIILDAGTGIHNLGQALLEQGEPVCGNILISHAHWDHVQGFPFFRPAYQKGNSFHFFGERKGEYDLATIIGRLMTYPYFPIPLEKMGAELSFTEIVPGDSFELGRGITVRTIASNHPNDCIAYRVQYGSRACCYVSDHEHSAEIDQDLLELCRGADVLIYDAHFTEEEYYGFSDRVSHLGWGHSTWQEGLKLL